MSHGTSCQIDVAPVGFAERRVAGGRNHPHHALPIVRIFGRAIDADALAQRTGCGQRRLATSVFTIAESFAVFISSRRNQRPSASWMPMVAGILRRLRRFRRQHWRAIVAAQIHRDSRR